MPGHKPYFAIIETLEHKGNDPDWLTFVRNLSVEAFHNLNRYQRNGQALFNALDALRPDIADAIRTTDADPFYVDENLPRFVERVFELYVESL